MKSFSEFLSEISVNMDLPKPIIQKIPRQGKTIVQNDDDPKKDIIPIVVHHKFFDSISEIRKEASMAGGHSAAIRVLLKIEDQIHQSKNAMAMVMVSSEEIHDLVDLAEKIMQKDSLESKTYMAAAYLKKTASNGVSSATNQFGEWLELREEKDACYYKVKKTASVWPSAYSSGRLVQCRKKGAKNWGRKRKKKKKKAKNESVQEIHEDTFKLEKEKGLHGWFSRNHGKGWIDCKASTKKKKVACGRKKTGKGAEREYPACRPTFSACNKTGKNRKKGPKTISWKEEK